MTLDNNTMDKKRDRMNFALIGSAGFIAPRHMEAIKQVGGNLVASLDPHDSMGILDSYFPRCAFFTEFERFDRYCSKVASTDQGVDWVVVCTPNYLHDSHCRFGLRIGANVICEKPLVLREYNLDQLARLEESSGKRIYTILQLRLLKPISAVVASDEYFRGNMIYITPRGLWWDYSWKSDESKSGGLATSIGIHLFDYLIYSFGDPLGYSVEVNSPRRVEGQVLFDRAEISFLLSLNNGVKARRVFIVGRKTYKLPNITDLHTESYERIMIGKGFGIEDIRVTTRLCESIRNSRTDDV